MKAAAKPGVQRRRALVLQHKAVREAFNPSNDWRIHLIFDLQGRPLHFQPPRSIDTEAARTA
jgi:hypothetical protein